MSFEIKTRKEVVEKNLSEPPFFNIISSSNNMSDYKRIKVSVFMPKQNKKA